MAIAKKTRKMGFSLPEIIIAMAVLLMVITTSTGILVTVIRTNSYNVDSLVAYGYAQEGIEAVRMMRDSNWKLGVEFDGKIDDTHSVWGEPLKNGDFVLVKATGLKNDCMVADVKSDEKCFPYSLAKYDEDDAIVRGKYSRKIILSEEDFDADQNAAIKNEVLDKRLKVISEVTWISNGVEREVTLETELTDWNG